MIDKRRRSRAVTIWTVLAALLVVVAVLEFNDRSKRLAPQLPSGPRMMMPAPLDEIAAIEIAYEGDLHRFARDEQSDAWFYHGKHSGPQSMHEHVPDAEMSKKITKSLEGLGRARIERRLEIQENDPFGVTKPQMILLIYLPNQVAPLAQYAVGDLAPDNLSRYVQRIGDTQVITIANYQIKNLVDLLAFVTVQSEQISNPGN